MILADLSAEAYRRAVYHQASLDDDWAGHREHRAVPTQSLASARAL
jgi:hypothetical protein